MGRDLLLFVLLICAAGGYVAWQNFSRYRLEDRAIAAESEAQRLRKELREARGSVQVVTEYVDRVRVVHERGATITKEIPVYVTPKADAGCPVPAGFVSVHDAAARNLPLDRPAGDPDAPAPGITLSAVADTVASNYGTCHALRAQVIGLQDYLRVVLAAHADAQAR